VPFRRSPVIPADSGPIPADSGGIWRNYRIPDGICGALKSTARTAMKKRTTSSEIAMDNLKRIAARNYFQNTGTNACYGMQNSTNQPNRPLRRSIDGLPSTFRRTAARLRCFVISGASRRSSYVEISLKQTYCQCLQLTNGEV